MANESSDTQSHATPPDVGSQQGATVYAKALLGATEAAGTTDAALAELDSLVSDVFDRFPALEQVLVSESIGHEEKEGILDRVLGQQASPTVLNFLKVLSKHGRLGLVRAVLRTAHELLDAMRRRIRVRVTTAVPADSTLKDTIADRLRAMLGGEPVLDMHTDPELIGGLVLHVGDTVYDGSVARRLQQVREQMINRSVHEIQIRRNSFRHSEGN